MLDYKKGYYVWIKADPVKLAAFVLLWRENDLAAAHRREQGPFLKEQYYAANQEYKQRQKALREERVSASATLPSRWLF